LYILPEKWLAAKETLSVTMFFDVLGPVVRKEDVWGREL